MQFARDFQAAKKEHKEKKIYEIRNKKQMPYGPDQSQITKEMFMRWYCYFQDEEVLDEIEKDVKRTRSDV